MVATTLPRRASRVLRNIARRTARRSYDAAVTDYRDVSFWLETSGDDLAPRPPLDGSADADVAILGAGLSGLWTAWYLLRRDPSLRVLVVEGEIAGF